MLVVVGENKKDRKLKGFRRMYVVYAFWHQHEWMDVVCILLLYLVYL